MAVGTVTGRDARVYMVSHNAGTAPVWTNKDSYDTFGIADFTITFSRDTISQDLIGVAGPYNTQGTISCDGSMTVSKFGGNFDILLGNLVDTGVTNTGTKYIAISANVSTTDATYLNVYLTSCQITGYDVTVGDAGTITNAAIDFIDLIPQKLSYSTGGTVTG